MEDRHSGLHDAGILLFSLYEAAILPLSDRDGLRRLASPRYGLWHASGT
jgi:hypothetical protein